MRVWRLSGFSKPEQAFSGDGARLFPGRWNREGASVVYTSEHLSLAALEALVHLEPRHFRRPRYAYSAAIPDELLEHFAVNDLRAGWDATEPSDATRDFGSQWAQSGRSLGLVVPSVVVVTERNVVINPEHPRFRELLIEGPMPFAFDARMLKRAV